MWTNNTTEYESNNVTERVLINTAPEKSDTKTLAIILISLISIFLIGLVISNTYKQCYKKCKNIIYPQQGSYDINNES